MKQILPLLILIGYFNQNATAQNKGAEDFKAIKKYFTVISSNGPFLELDPIQNARKENDWVPKKKCYAVYVQADNFSGAVSAVVVLARTYNLEFRDEIIHFRQNTNDKYTKRGYVIVYTTKKGTLPKLESLLEF